MLLRVGWIIFLSLIYLPGLFPNKCFFESPMHCNFELNVNRTKKLIDCISPDIIFSDFQAIRILLIGQLKNVSQYSCSPLTPASHSTDILVTERGGMVHLYNTK